MAGSTRYTAVLDANTLYPALLRDLLLTLAVDGLYHARWTDRIQAEWVRNLAISRPDIAPRLAALVELMNRAVPDCVVHHDERLIDGLTLPDVDDRHVLAAEVSNLTPSQSMGPVSHSPDSPLAAAQADRVSHPSCIFKLIDRYYTNIATLLTRHERDRRHHP